MLAHARCNECGGSGLLISKEDVEPCNCVCRRIFDICLYRYNTIRESSGYESPIVISNLLNASRPHEEFAADFVLTSRRTLNTLDEPGLLDIFELHIVKGADLDVCSRKLKIPRPILLCAVRRMESFLGKTFRELRPYPLFPLYEYFARGTVCAPQC